MDATDQVIKQQVHKFFRNSILALHFIEDRNDRDWNAKLHQITCRFTQSSWLPPERNLFHVLEQQFRPKLDMILKENPRRYTRKDRITKHLESLKARPDIRIIQSDKNLGLVAIGTDEYDKLVQDHLKSDQITSAFHLNLTNVSHLINWHFNNEDRKLFIQPETYVGGFEPLIATHISLYRRGVHFKKFTAQEEKVLHCTEIIIPKFHCIAKVHKKQLAGRPITAALRWITTNWSVLATIQLQKMFKKSPVTHVLKNSQAVIPLILKARDNDAEYTAVSFDVKALYPNIKLDRLFADLAALFGSIGGNDAQFWVTVIRFICNTSYFTYRGDVYHQTDGIAMGTNVAVELANFYMHGRFDKPFVKFIDRLISDHTRNNGRAWMQSPDPRARSDALYGRYIDDSLLLLPTAIWRSYKNKILDHLKEYKEDGLEFTHEEMDPTLAILDLDLFRDEQGKIAYKLFQKSMNKYLYLTPDSMHPRHTIVGYVKGELTRFKRNSFYESDYEYARLLFCRRLMDRGFTPALILEAFCARTWDTAPTRITRDPREISVALVTPYTRRQVPIAQEIHRLLENLDDNDKSIIERFKFVMANTTCSSVAQICISSDVTPEEESYLANSEQNASNSSISSDGSIPCFQQR